MQSQASHKQYGTPLISTHGYNLLDARIMDWRERRADPLDLAYAFFVLLDDAALREVFGDFMVPASSVPTLLEQIQLIVGSEHGRLSGTQSK